MSDGSSGQTQRPLRPGARAWVIFAIAVFAYIAAVTQRSTLGVASVDAGERFSTSAALLSAMAVLQLTVYALMQIPGGVLADRFGSRVLIVGGSAIMASGQVLLAFSTDVGWAIAARVLVGAGDAVVFISVIRLLPFWFSGRTVPILTQWVGTLGQLGQVVSAIPFAIVLHSQGWTTAFLAVAAIAVLATVLSLAVLRDRPATMSRSDQPDSMRAAFAHLMPTLRRPGTQLGFWSHFVTQSPGTVFTLFWGYPFMVLAVGLDAAAASAILIVLVVAGLIAGPILGLLTARYPLRRSNLVLGTVLLMAGAWAVVLLWPGTPPLWLIVLLAICLGVGGPGSMIGFDFARTFNPRGALGSANGIVNVGGFAASVTMMLIIGIVLDAIHAAGWSSTLYALDSFRVAFVAQYAVVGVGVVLLLHARKRVRSQLLESEGLSVAPLWVALIAGWRRRRIPRKGA